MLQQAVRKWFEKNKKNLVWVTDTIKYKTAADWKYESPYHPAGGYFRLKKQ
jgi:hypothetical protein